MANIKQAQSGRRKNSDKVKAKSERRTVPKPRRKSKPKTDKDLYQLPKLDIKEFIKKERRHDELDRINEVREQRRVWRQVVAICVLVNIALFSLAMIGLFV